MRAPAAGPRAASNGADQRQPHDFVSRCGRFSPICQIEVPACRGSS